MTITLTEAQHRLHTLIESQGNKVAGGPGTNCMYFDQDGAPSCLVGHAFAAELAAAGVAYGVDDNEDSVQGLVDNLILDAEPLAAEYLGWAQEQQDSGLTWASAVTWADQALAEALYQTADEIVIAADGQLVLTF